MSSIPTYIRQYLWLSYISQAFTFAVPLLAAILSSRDSLDESTVSLLLVGIFTLSGIFQIIVGKFFDKGKYILSLSVSFVSVLVGLLIYIFCFDRLILFVLGSSILIFGVGIIGASIIRSIEGSVGEELRARVTNSRYMVSNLGFCTAAILGFFFLDRYRTLLLIGDLITTLSVIVFLFFIFSKLMKEQKMKISTSGGLMSEKFFSILRSKWKIFLGMQLIQIEVFAHTEVQPVLYARLGLEPVKWTTYLLFFNTITAIATIGYINRLSKKCELRQLALWGTLFYSLGHVCIPYFISPLGIAVTTMISVIGEVLWVAPITIVLFRQFSEHNRGMASGLRSSMRSFSFVCNPILGYLLFTMIPDVKLGFSLIYGLIPLLGFYLIFGSELSSKKSDMSPT
ncbi:MAG: hypothetical protein KDD52_00785 [Bdellovibrionales bacterium]|nr:hypothetical protein [Bdellovibrionales bacterium]